jgi:hypothetical protein
MKIQTFSFIAGGWSNQPDGTLDSDRTLVVLFGASNLIDRPAPVQRVIDAYPRSSDLHNQAMTLTTISEA